MRAITLRESNIVFNIIRMLVLWLAVAPLLVLADGEIRISEAKGGYVKIELSSNEPKQLCTGKIEPLFDPELGIKKVSERVYLQQLNSEVGGNAVYLKAARMGGGIYMYLPYFIPNGDCPNVVFNVEAKHILWDGKWQTGNVRISTAAVRQKAIFFTNEPMPLVEGASYFDHEIPAPVLVQLKSSFGQIITFYQNVLGADPMRNIGVVAAIAHNDGKYFGFGGDSLNIIRMSYDNPRPDDLLSLHQIFPNTFAHELAHKLQNEKLFKYAPARYIVEGGADFLKVIVLRGAGLIDDEKTKEMVLKAATECGKFADERSLFDKVQQKAFNYREAYDCGMVYYFIAYYSSDLPEWDFMDIFLKAMSGQKNYSDHVDSLCLLFETSCKNERLNGVTGSKTSFLQQGEWLKGKLAAHSFVLARRQK